MSPKRFNKKSKSSKSKSGRKSLKKKNDALTTTVYEVGVARAIKDVNGKPRAVSTFSVRVAKGNDGKRRTVIVARRSAFEDDFVNVVEHDNGEADVYATKLRIRILDNLELGDVVKELGKTATLADLIAALLEAGLIQIDIEGPSAAKFDGNPLSSFANAIITSLDRVTRMNLTSSEEEVEETKPRKRKLRLRRTKSEDEVEEEAEDEYEEVEEEVEETETKDESEEPEKIEME